MTGRISRASKAAQARAESVSRRGHDWAEHQDPTSFRGVAIEAWRRYRAVDGPLQTALLSLYTLIAVVPALLVMVEYLDRHPGALADHIVRHYDLSRPTATLLRGVLTQDRAHELGSALLAIAGALFFGLGLGRVLQLVHLRAWGIELKSKGADQVRYALVLVGFYGLLLLLLVQLAELAGQPAWHGYVLIPVWLAVLVAFFVWAPRLVTHGLISGRDLLPSAVLTAFGLLALMLISRFAIEFWVDLYAKDYGGFGVVMAIYFWIAFSSFVIVGAASLSPALTQRRSLRSDNL